jgi:aminopeptidase N
MDTTLEANMIKRAAAFFVVLMTMGLIQAQNNAPEQGADGLGDPYFPLLGNGGYDAEHYTLDLTWDDQQNSLTGTVTILAKAYNDLSRFDLDFEGFNISSILVDGKEAAFKRDGRELQITPSASLKQDETFETAVSYSGIPGGGVTDYYDVFARGWNRYDTGVYVASEPDGAAYWYPVNDHPLDKATYTFKITVPDAYMVAANGLLQKVDDNPDPTTTYTWETRDELASYLATVNIAKFTEQQSVGPHDLPIRNYFPPDQADQLGKIFADFPKMIGFYETIFGPYPFEAAGAVVPDTKLSFALETQTLILFGKDISVGRTGAQTVIAHELAHQWFGDSVSLTRWKDVWLNEGFATYASMLWLEHDKGQAAMTKQMDTYYKVIVEQGTDYVPPANPPKDDLFNDGVYLRGAWALHALRLKVGDKLFFNIMHTYYDHFKYGNATTTDFTDVATEVSGQDLQDFFQHWLLDEKVPHKPEQVFLP